VSELSPVKYYFLAGAAPKLVTSPSAVRCLCRGVRVFWLVYWLVWQLVRRQLIWDRRSRYQWLANNVNKDRAWDTDFYIENPYGKKPWAPTGDLHYTKRVYKRRKYNESSALPVWLTRCIYRTDWLQLNTETNPLINITRTAGPSGVSARLTLEFGSYSNKIDVSLTNRRWSFYP
jgi:hypothetical protein